MIKNTNFEVWKPGHPEIEQVRQIFSARMSHLYSGWSDVYDRQFDPNSFIFVYRSNNTENYSATCRIAFKHHGGRVFTTPSETADLNRYILPMTSPNCCEGSMISFTSLSDLRSLMYGVTLWLTANSIDDLFATHDLENPFIQRFFTRTLGFHPVEGAIVRYQNFLVSATGKPATWQILRVNPLLQCSATLNRLVKVGVEPYELPADSPMLSTLLKINSY
jgi:hypothetical protein